MANGNSGSNKGLTTGETVAVTIGSVLAAALGAGVAALVTKGGGASKQTGTQNGPRLKKKGCGGCGR